MQTYEDEGQGTNEDKVKYEERSTVWSYTMVSGVATSPRRAEVRGTIPGVAISPRQTRGEKYEHEAKQM